MGKKSLLCTLCENPVLEEKIRISHDFDMCSDPDPCSKKGLFSSCTTGNVEEKFIEISNFINYININYINIIGQNKREKFVIGKVKDLFKMLSDEKCYDDKDFVDFCVDLSIAANYVYLFYFGYSDNNAIQRAMTALKLVPGRQPRYQELIEKMLMISGLFEVQRGGKRRRRRKSRSKSRRKSRKTKRKRRKSRKTKKRRRRRR